jgi:hypothetical protein
MATRDEHSTKLIVDANTAVISTDTTTNGATIDTQNYESVEFIGHASITDGTYTFVMQESTDGSTWSTVASDFVLYNGRKASPSDDLPTLVNATDDDTWFRFGYVGKERYVRLNIVSASTTTGATMIIGAALEHFRHQATPEQPAA